MLCNAKIKRRKATVLITTLSMLFVLSIMGITFAKVSNLNLSAANNATMQAEAHMIAEAGIEMALATMRDKFSASLFDIDLSSRVWLYSGDATTTSKGHIDSIGCGIPIEKASQPEFVENIGGSDYNYFNVYPSYGGDLGGRQASGMLDEVGRRTHTLKILDCSSQININMEHQKLAEILFNLSKAVQETAEYTGSHSNGPLQSLTYCTQIKDKAPYRTKQDLYDKHKSWMSEDDYAAIRDYITVHPSRTTMSSSSVYNDQNPYKTATSGYRAPININTASWPVLVAVLADLEDGGVSISYTEAKVMAQCICDKRSLNGFFISWNAFGEFLQDASDDVWASASDSERETRIAIIAANADPNSHDPAFNPDDVAYQSKAKSYLDYSTTEFCFFSFGYFEIIALGQLLDPHLKPVASAKVCTVAKLFNVLCHRTQKEFEKANKDAITWLPAKYAQNAFTHPQEMTTTTDANCLDGYDANKGYIGPYNYVDNVSPLDNTDDQLFGGFKGPFSFRCSFNGSENPEIYQNGLMSNSKNNIGADGLYQGYMRAESSDTDSDETDDSIPNKQGTLMFWFKPSKNLDNNYRQVFFARTFVKSLSSIPGIPQKNSGDDDDDDDDDGGGTVPLSRDGSDTSAHLYQEGDTIYVSAADGSTPQSLGKPSLQLETRVYLRYDSTNKQMTIRVERKFIAGPVQITNDDVSNQFPAEANLHGDEVGNRIEWTINDSSLPFRAREWYHFAVRWQDYVDFDFGSGNPAMVVSGFFHDDEGTQLHRGNIDCQNHGSFNTEVLEQRTINELDTDSGDANNNFAAYFNARSDDLQNSYKKTFDDQKYDSDGDGTDDRTPSEKINMDEKIKVDNGAALDFDCTVDENDPPNADVAHTSHTVDDSSTNWTKYNADWAKLFIREKFSPSTWRALIVYSRISNSNRVTVDDIGITWKTDIFESGSYAPSRYPNPNHQQLATYDGEFDLPDNDASGMSYNFFVVQRTWPNKEGGTTTMPTGNPYYLDSTSRSDIPWSHKDWGKIFKEANKDSYLGVDLLTDLGRLVKWNKKHDSHPGRGGGYSGGHGHGIGKYLKKLGKGVKKGLKKILFSGDTDFGDSEGAKPLWQTLLDYYYENQDRFAKLKVPPRVGVVGGSGTPTAIEIQMDDLGHNHTTHKINYRFNFRTNDTSGNPLFRMPIVDTVYLVYPITPKYHGYLQMIK